MSNIRNFDLLQADEVLGDPMFQYFGCCISEDEVLFPEVLDQVFDGDLVHFANVLLTYLYWRGQVNRR